MFSPPRDEHSAIYAFFGRPNAVLITSLGVLSQYSRYCTISPLAGSRVSTQRPVTVTTCAAQPRTRLGNPYAQVQPWAGAATGRRLSTGRRAGLKGMLKQRSSSKKKTTSFSSALTSPTNRTSLLSLTNYRARSEQGLH